MTERGQCMLKSTVRRSHQLSAESIAKDSCCLLRASWNGFPWPSSYIQAIHHQVQSVECSGVKHAATGLE
ncbi:unnamed protein product, partial [Staurois parvus]